MHYVKSMSERNGPVPFSKIGAMFGKRAKNLGVAISEYVENDPAFVVTHPTPYSRACVLAESMTLSERIMAIVTEEQAMSYEALVNRIMDAGILRPEIEAEIERLHSVRALIRGPYLSLGDTVRVSD